MAVVYSNNASTALTSGITNSATSITVGSVADFPTLTGSDYYYATLANVTNTKIEIVKVTAAAGTTLTVVRGQDNTTAVSFDASDNFQLRVTAATLESATSTDVAITGGSVSTSTITDATSSAKGLATAAQITKLDAIEASADVTDVTNVTAAGALMDSEVTNLADVKAFDTTDYATAAQGATANAALPKAGGAMTGAITTNSTFDGRDVATDGSKLDGIATSANNYVHPNHSGDVTSTADGATVISSGAVDIAMLSATGTASGTTFLRGDNTWVVPTDTNTTYSVGDGGLTEINFTSADNTKLDGIETGATADQTQSDINALGITATSVDLGNWTITESSGVAYFATGGVNKMKLDASGNLTVVGDITAFGTI